MVTTQSPIPVCETSAWQAGTVAITGGHLAYHRTGGGGPALVLSHGLTDNGLCWSRFARAMAGEYDIVMLDARGHGASSRMPIGELHDPGRDIAEAIDRLGLKSPIVMGHSVGARATAAFAGANPDLAKSIVLEDPPLLPHADKIEVQARREKFRRHIADLQALSDAEIAALGKTQSPDWHDDEFPAWVLGKRQVDPEAMPDYVVPWQEGLAAIRTPTLLIYGETERGGLVTAEIAETAIQINPWIRAICVQGAGHNVRRENFEGFLSAVRPFLTESQKTKNIGEAIRDD